MTILPNLISKWTAEGNATDVIGGNDGVLLAGVTFAPGKVGQAFRFDGSPEAYIQLPDAANLFPASGRLTIEAWIKPNFSVANEWDTVLTKRDFCHSDNVSYQLAVNKGDPNDIYGAVVLALSTGERGGITRVTSGAVRVPDDGAFHHIAGTFDGATAKVYLNGLLVGEAAHAVPLVTTASAPTIGHHGGGCGQRADGLIDEIAFYDRGLTAAEIASLAGLVPQFPFTGFFPPVDNPPVWNEARAGRAIPVQFSLGGDRGLNIFAPGYPQFVHQPCTGGATDVIEQTVTAGASGLSYDPATQQYTYVWKSNAAWAGQCGTLNVNLVDGSSHTAKFKFTR